MYCWPTIKYRVILYVSGFISCPLAQTMPFISKVTKNRIPWNIKEYAIILLQVIATFNYSTCEQSGKIDFFRLLY